MSAGYKIVCVLSKGQNKCVYKAEDSQTHCIVAIKMLVPAASEEGDVQAKLFLREAQTMAAQWHPDIVGIFATVQEGRFFHVMEFIEGESLDKRLDGRPWPDKKAAQLVARLARAVDAIHQTGIMHLYLMPSHILMTKEGQPKIGGFGLALPIDQYAGKEIRAGSPKYTPPEQLARDVNHVGPWSDVYALGAILYELLTGQAPQENLVTLPQVAPELEAICSRCLAKSPTARYQTAEALAGDLEQFLRN